MTERCEEIWDATERRMFALRALYRRCGYERYRMGKFEEYDLYSRNKDFLVSDNIITFTDTNGKLMALKPDVTLSIVRNLQDDPAALRKLCYNENVYRAAKGGGTFREIMQTGLECIGRIDSTVIGEVLLLAAKSLALCADAFVLEISHLDILQAFVAAVSDDAAVVREILRCVDGKNIHGIAALCAMHGISAERAEGLRALLALYGVPKDVLPALGTLCAAHGLTEAWEELRSAAAVFDGTELAGRIRIDFSAVGNMNYYNGILLRGFAAGVPGSVLSGGQYDKLMRKMGKRSGAVGFAVYLDMLARLDDTDGGVVDNA